MRNLHVVEENHIFQLHGVAYYAVCAHQRAAADKGAVPNLRAGADDAGGSQKRCGGHGGGFMYPDGGRHFPVTLAQLGAEGENQSLDPAQCLPGIFKSGKIFPGEGMGQIIQLVYF